MGKKARKVPRSKAYSGVLAKPLPWRSVPFPHARPSWFAGTEEEWERNRCNIVRADLERYGECWLEVYKHFGIDLKEPDAEARLLRALVSADPIPAFDAPSKRAGQPTRLEDADTITLLAEIARISSTESERTGVVPSDSRLAKKLSHTPVCKTKRLGEHRIRALLRDLRSASRAYDLGTATEFQRRYVEVVRPFLLESLEPEA